MPDKFVLGGFHNREQQFQGRQQTPRRGGGIADFVTAPVSETGNSAAQCSVPQLSDVCINVYSRCPFVRIEVCCLSYVCTGEPSGLFIMCICFTASLTVYVLAYLLEIQVPAPTLGNVQCGPRLLFTGDPEINPFNRLRVL